MNFFTLFGINFTIWTIIGLIRFTTEKFNLAKILKNAPPHSFLKWVFIFFKISGISLIFTSFVLLFKNIIRKIKSIKSREYNNPNFISQNNNQIFSEKNLDIKPEEVAAIIPAHNEESTIAKTIISLVRIMPAKNIFVGSDASTDRTVDIVREWRCNVYDINPNKGKANVLAFLLEHYQILEKYKAVIIIDADSEVDENYLTRSLPLFKDPDVIAVAVHAMSKWRDHWPPCFSQLYTAYRVRLYRVLQAIIRYGQTWKYTNASPIIPGFASIYRTSVLSHININAPGLVIEDYNMTFEVHHKKLGKIAYRPGIFGKSQDPLSFKDYFKQIKRWNLGLWQTVRRHGFWPSFFSLAMIVYLLEMIFFALFFLIIPILFIWIAANSFEPILFSFDVPIMGISQIRFIDLLIGIFLIDYIITLIVALYEKKPVILIYGFLFIFLRYLDAFILLYTIPLAYTTKSDGRWISPKR